MTGNTITRHPLHSSIREAAAERFFNPEAHVDNFVETLSKILMDSFFKGDVSNHMEQFLADPGVEILRLCISCPDKEVLPGGGEAYHSLHGRYLDELAQNPCEPTTAHSNGLMLCSPLSGIQDLLDIDTLRNGGMVGFFDPIYEESLVLIKMSRGSRADWILRLCDSSVAA